MFKTGDKVSVSRLQGTSEPFETRVEVLEKGGTLLLHPPSTRSSVGRISDGDRYAMLFTTEAARYSFDAIALGYVRVDGMEMLRFQLANKGRKIQQRNSFRFVCQIPILLRVVSDSGEQGAAIEATVRDLSGSGIKMACNTDIPNRALLRLDLQLNDDYLLVFGEVRMKKHTPELKVTYQYGVEFTALPEADVDTIVRYVTAEQRKLLKRSSRSIYDK